MRSTALLPAVLLCLPAMTDAQTEGRVSVGATVSRVFPTESDVRDTWTFGPLVRLNPKRGWGPAGGLGWFRADIDDPNGGGGFARLRVRPLTAGVAYTIGSDKILTSFSVVAGPSFNSIDFRDAFLQRVAGTGAPPEIDIDNSFVVRPGVNVTVTVAPRVAIVGFGGYSFNRPDVTYRDPSGTQFRNRWKADAAAVSVAAVYSLF